MVKGLISLGDYSYCAGISLGYFYTSLGEKNEIFGRWFYTVNKNNYCSCNFHYRYSEHCRCKRPENVGMIAGKSMIYFLTFSTPALMVELIGSNLVQSGAGINIDPILRYMDSFYCNNLRCCSEDDFNTRCRQIYVRK